VNYLLIFEYLARVMGALGIILTALGAVQRYLHLRKRASANSIQAMQSELAIRNRTLEALLIACYGDRDRAERAVKAYERTNVQFWGE